MASVLLVSSSSSGSPSLATPHSNCVHSSSELRIRYVHVHVGYEYVYNVVGQWNTFISGVGTEGGSEGWCPPTLILSTL